MLETILAVPREELRVRAFRTRDEPYGLDVGKTDPIPRVFFRRGLKMFR